MAAGMVRKFASPEAGLGWVGRDGLVVAIIETPSGPFKELGHVSLVIGVATKGKKQKHHLRKGELFPARLLVADGDGIPHAGYRTPAQYPWVLQAVSACARPRACAGISAAPACATGLHGKRHEVAVSVADPLSRRLAKGQEGAAMCRRVPS